MFLALQQQQQQHCCAASWEEGTKDYARLTQARSNSTSTYKQSCSFLHTHICVSHGVQLNTECGYSRLHQPSKVKVKVSTKLLTTWFTHEAEANIAPKTADLGKFPVKQKVKPNHSWVNCCVLYRCMSQKPTQTDNRHLLSEKNNINGEI